jgi:hypothetical protein
MTPERARWLLDNPFVNPNACALADAGNAGTMRRRGTAFRLNL